MDTKDWLAIVSISDIKNIIKFYGILTVFLIATVVIYEQFSFGVTSFHMRMSILVPVIYGLLEMGFLKLKSFRSTFQHILNMGMITWILALFLYGVVEIYGTTSPLISPLYIIGSVVTIIGIVGIVLEKKRS
jgi:hypothetical protein